MINRRRFSSFLATGASAAIATLTSKIGKGEPDVGSKAPETTRLAQLPLGSSKVRLDPVRNINAPSGVTSLAWSPDQSKIAVAVDFGKQVAVFDALSGRQLTAFKRALSISRFTVGFSADSQLIVSTAADTSRTGSWAVGIWEAQTGRLVRQLARPAAPWPAFGDIAEEVHVSPDGRYVLVLAPLVPDGSTIRKEALAVYDTVTWELMRVITAPPTVDPKFPSNGFKKPLAIGSGKIAVCWRQGRPIWEPEKIRVFVGSCG